MDKQYTITLNETQLKTLEWVTEGAARTIMGQLDMFVQDCAERAWERDHRTPEHPSGILADGWHDMRHQLEQHLDDIRKLCWAQDRHTMYGIHYDDKADELWDMHQVLRKFRYDHIFGDDERKTMRMTVMADAPLKTSAQPLIKISDQ